MRRCLHVLFIFVLLDCTIIFRCVEAYTERFRLLTYGLSNIYVAMIYAGHVTKPRDSKVTMSVDVIKSRFSTSILKWSDIMDIIRRFSF